MIKLKSEVINGEVVFTSEEKAGDVKLRSAGSKKRLRKMFFIRYCIQKKKALNKSIKFRRIDLNEASLKLYEQGKN